MLSSNDHKNRTQNQVYMKLTKMNIAGKDGKFIEVVVCFDGGSDRSWITSAMVKKLKPTWVTAEDLVNSTFGQENLGPSSLRNLYKVTVGSLFNSFKDELVLTEVPTICRTLFRPSLPSEFLDLENSAQYELFDNGMAPANAYSA